MRGNMIFYYILENYQIGDRGLLMQGVRDIASKSFDSILLQIRDTAFQLDDPQVIHSVEIVTNEAHRLGLKCYLTFITTSCRPWYYSFFKRYPKAGELHVTKGYGRIKNKLLTAKMDVPASISPFIGRFEGVLRTFLKTGYGFKILKQFPYKFNISREAGINKFGKWWIADRTTITILAKIHEIETGEVVVYGAFRDLNPDYASREFRKFMDYLLGLYKHINLDGVVWDEPGAPGDCSYYKLGEDFCRRFKAMHGYDIRNKLYLLDYEQKDSGKLRYHYFKTLRDILFDSQTCFVKKARNLFGKKIFSGVHHTWVGESSVLQDLACGCIDYFYLGKNLTGGFTDGQFCDEKSLIYSLILARSLGKSNKYKKGFSNCWNWSPTREELCYFTRLMGIWKLNWIAHAYGHGLRGFGPGYPYHYTWVYMGEAVRRIRRIHNFIGELSLAPRIAIYHSWEGIARINTPFIQIYKTSLINLTNTLVKENIPFDFIGEEQLSNFKVMHGKLHESYDLIILPWACMLPATVWKKIKNFYKSNGKIIFFGPPAVELTDGRNISKKFFTMVGTKPFSLGEYLKAYKNGEDLTERPRQSDFTYPLRNTDGKIVMCNNKNIGIRNPKKPVYYIPSADPREKVLKVIKDFNLNSGVETKAQGVHYALYESANEIVFMVCGQHDKRFSGIFKFHGYFLDIGGAKFFGIKIKDNTCIIHTYDKK